ncbi:MAG: hypothetical protein ACREQ7_23705, partial [Candidatus Binatia bacterium]
MKRSKPSNERTKHKTKATRSAECAERRGGRNHEELAKAPAAIHRVSQDRCRPAETSQILSERKRLFLSVGDEVSHLRYDEWGFGVVMETMTSSVPGGTCLARIRFQDGQLRCFNNDLDNESCCY